MIEENSTILENVNIAKDVFRMKLTSANTDKLRPGQFINIKIDGLFLRRPISLCQIEDGVITIIYKVFGQGTKKLSSYKEGDLINIHLNLGNGFVINPKLERILLIGGGVGVPPLYELAKRYRQAGKEVVAVLGFRSKDEVFLEEELKALGLKVYVATDDGSYGHQGNVISLIDACGIDIDFVYSVGPKAVLKAVQDKYQKGFISLEERMGCGMGACMGCVCHDSKDQTKHYRVCKEGPVFELGKVVL